MLGRAWRRLQRRRPRSDERGFTLVEMLITVWILGAIVTAFAGAMFTMIRSSSLERTETLLETELRHYSEAVQAQAYWACADMLPTNPYLTPPGYTSSTSPAVNPSVTSMSYWYEPALGSSDFSTFKSSTQLHTITAGSGTTFATRDDCDNTKTLQDDGVQQVTLRVTDSASGIFLETTITKRATLCSPPWGCP